MKRILLLCCILSLTLFAAAKAEELPRVGGTFAFGTYPQTADGTDQTPIEWVVLDVQGDRALLISRFGLDVRPYHDKWTDTAWETCTLRAWLNGEFFSRAFTEKEQAAVLTVTLDNGRKQGYWDIGSGKDTQDRVFLLSYAEAARYFGTVHFTAKSRKDNLRSRLQPTDYALSRGASVSSEHITADGMPACWWWLRSSGRTRDRASYVDSEGDLDGSYVDSATGCVRPALWIDLTAAGR